MIWGNYLYIIFFSKILLDLKAETESEGNLCFLKSFHETELLIHLKRELPKHFYILEWKILLMKQ